MDIIRGLVGNLAILLILSALLEMLLPMGNLRNYVKMIMGLFLIVTMMNPVLKVLKQPVAFQVTDTDLRTQTQGILDKGQQLQKTNEEVAIHKYEQTLAQQVKAVAKLAPNVSVQKVQVSIDEDKQNGEIKQISLVVSPAKNEKGSISLVEPVQIKPHHIQTNKKSDDAQTATANVGEISLADKQNLVETIANFYNLPPEKVILQVK